MARDLKSFIAYELVNHRRKKKYIYGEHLLSFYFVLGPVLST